MIMEKQELRKYRQQVGQQYNAARTTQGWSVEQVAQMADVKTDTIEKIEAGAFNVPLDVLSRVAEVLGCELNIKTKE